MTSNMGPILVFHRIQPFGSHDFSSLDKVYSRHVTGSVNCENSSVCLIMKYCPTSTIFTNPASVQNLITRSCCESLSTRSVYFCNKFSCAGISIDGVVLYLCSQLRSYSNHSQDTRCTIMDDCMTKASDLFPTQTQIENLNSSAVWLECATCPCNKQTPCKCHTRGQERRPHKEFTTAGNIHLNSNTPPRCGAIRHSATRFEISTQGLAFLTS